MNLGNDAQTKTMKTVCLEMVLVQKRPEQMRKGGEKSAGESRCRKSCDADELKGASQASDTQTGADKIGR